MSSALTILSEWNIGTMDNISEPSLQELSQMEHAARMRFIISCSALASGINQMAAAIYSGVFPRKKKDLALAGEQFEQWKLKNSKYLSIDILASALATRIAPDVIPKSFPPDEVPVGRYQVGDTSSPLRPEWMLSQYNDWLDQDLKTSGLTRAVEMAWVRICEKGVALNSSHDRDYAFYTLYWHFDSLVKSCFRTACITVRNEDLEDAVAKAWSEFYKSFLESNPAGSEPDSALRERWTAICGLVPFLALSMALRRLPRLSFWINQDVVDVLQQADQPADIIDACRKLIGQSWKTRSQYLNAIEMTLGRGLSEPERSAVTNFAKRAPSIRLSTWDHTCDGPDGSDVESDPSRLRLIQSLLTSKLPDGGDILAVIGKERLQAILKSRPHWDGCRRPAAGMAGSLTEVQMGRLTSYCIDDVAAGEIAEESQSTDAAISLSLAAAFRKIRCCIISELGDVFDVEAKRRLQLYLRLADKPVGMQDPWPAPGLLGTQFTLDTTSQLCDTGDTVDQLALEYHFFAKTIGELAKSRLPCQEIEDKYPGSKGTRLVEQCLRDHWRVIFPQVNQALQELRSD